MQTLSEPACQMLRKPQRNQERQQQDPHRSQNDSVQIYHRDQHEQGGEGAAQTVHSSTRGHGKAKAGQHALPDKVLSPYQMLELEWKVGEEKSLQDFGPLSPKSKRAIHSYLSIFLLKEILANEKELSAHFFIDDILDLGSSFLQYLQEQLLESRLKLCSASVHTSEHISAERVLQLSISKEGEALISPAQA